MPQDPLKPADDGKIKLPPVDAAMNKLPPKSGAGTPDDAKGNAGEGKPNEVDEDEARKEKRRTREQKQRDDDKLLTLARKRFKRCVAADSDNRKAALEDLKFKAGDQWPSDIKNRRFQDKRPCLTINKIPSLTHQVTNDLRQNRPAINISPIGMKADKEGAKAFAGMINAIERDSAADIAYDTAIGSSADIGFGYVRILTEFENERSMNRVIVIKRVRNSFTVNLDPERQEPDGCDSKFGFVSENMTREEFKEKHPDAQAVPWDNKSIGDDLPMWANEDTIRVAEYFTVEHEMKRLVQLSNGNVEFYDNLGAETKEQITKGEAAGGLNIIDERQAECQTVMWYKITVVEVLEANRWDGRWIPIVEFVGEEIDIEGKVIRSGVIRNAKDPQRMKNYWATAKTELAALAPKAPYVAPEGSFEGYEQFWKQANTKSYPFLEYVPQFGPGGQLLPAPTRQEPPAISTALVEAEKSSEQDMMSTSGVQLQSEVPDARYDESGKKLIESRRNVGLGSFHIADNAARSLRHVGRILVDLIPKTYDTKRVVTILQEDDTEERVTIDPTAQQPMQHNAQAKDSAARKIFNPGMGEYGVTVTIGPSFATKRIEASEQMMAFAKAMPEKGAMIAHLIAKYSDWPGADECYKILVKALPPNLLTPDIRDLPPQIAAFVQALTGKIASLMAERTQMLRDLTDKTGDRALKKAKMDQDFEAKLLKLLGDLKMHAMDFDQTMISTAIDATNQFHVGVDKGLDREHTLALSQVKAAESPVKSAANAPA